MSNPEECAIALIPPEKLEEELESVLQKYVRERVIRAAEGVKLALSGEKGLEVANKLLELAEKVRLVADDETFLRNVSELFDALRNAVGIHLDSTASPVWIKAFDIATAASALAAFGSWAALLACIKGLHDSSVSRKMLGQIVAIHKRENHALFAAVKIRRITAHCEIGHDQGKIVLPCRLKFLRRGRSFFQVRSDAVSIFAPGIRWTPI